MNPATDPELARWEAVHNRENFAAVELERAQVRIFHLVLDPVEIQRRENDRLRRALALTPKQIRGPRRQVFADWKPKESP